MSTVTASEEWFRVTAWANGFGTWHVRVTEYGVGNAVRAQRRARSRMVEELTGRTAFDPARLRVKRVSRVSEGGVLVSEYVESWQGDR